MSTQTKVISIIMDMVIGIEIDESHGDTARPFTDLGIDSLDPEKFNSITQRQYFERVEENIRLLEEEGFHVKLNCVVIKGFNENEIQTLLNSPHTGNYMSGLLNLCPSRITGGKGRR